MTGCNCSKVWHRHGQLQDQLLGRLQDQLLGQTECGSIRSALMVTSAMNRDGIGRQHKFRPILEAITAQGLPRRLDGANLVA